jgi:probable HAF family extracellular repeat protein
MKIKIVLCLTALAVLAGLVAPVRFSAQRKQRSEGASHYYVFNLGTLGGDSSSGNSINTLGWVTGISNLAGNTDVHAALWLYGRQFDLGTLGGPNSGTLWPVHNNRGVIAGVSDTSEFDPLGETWSCGAFFPASHTTHTCVGFVWKHGVMTPLPTLGGNNGFATGANDTGQVVGWAETTTHDPTCVSPQVLQFEAVIYGLRPNQIQELPPLPGDPDGAATAINDQGQVVGISGICQVAVGDLSAEHALLWQNGKATNLGSLGGAAWNTPMAINNRGEVVGFSDLPGDDGGQNPNFHAFLWTREGGMRDLGTLPGDVLSEALGINDEGQVVGVSIDANNNLRAFLWQNGIMTDLNTLMQTGSSLDLIAAGDINDFGVISGQAYHQETGALPAFVAIPLGGHPPMERASRRVMLPGSVRQRLFRRLGLGRIEARHR